MSKPLPGNDAALPEMAGQEGDTLPASRWPGSPFDNSLYEGAAEGQPPFGRSKPYGEPSARYWEVKRVTIPAGQTLTVPFERRPEFYTVRYKKAAATDGADVRPGVSATQYDAVWIQGSDILQLPGLDKYISFFADATNAGTLTVIVVARTGYPSPF